MSPFGVLEFGAAPSANPQAVKMLHTRCPFRCQNGGTLIPVKAEAVAGLENHVDMLTPRRRRPQGLGQHAIRRHTLGLNCHEYVYARHTKQTGMVNVSST